MNIIEDSGVNITGKVSLVCRDTKTGLVKGRRDINNLVMQGGKDLIASVFSGAATSTVTHIGLGENTPTTPANISQTVLVSPLSPRGSVTSTLHTGPASIEYKTTFGSGNVVGNIGEAGLFTSLTGGLMVARTTFPVIPKEADDELVITWTLFVG